MEGSTMEKNAKDKITRLKRKQFHARIICLKGGLFFGFVSGCALTFCLFRALLKSERFSEENRQFYKARLTEIKDALCQIKAHLKQPKVIE